MKFGRVGQFGGQFIALNLVMVNCTFAIINQGKANEYWRLPSLVQYNNLQFIVIC